MKKFRIVLFGLVLLGFFTACSIPTSSDDDDDNGGGGSAPLADASAQSLTVSVMTGVSQAISAAVQGGLSPNLLEPRDAIRTPALSTSTINYSGSGYSVSGEITAGTDIQYLLEITFSGYSSGDVRLNSGRASYYFYSLSTGTINGSYGGSFSVTYQGKTYAYSWNITISGSTSGYTYRGSFTLDGYTYTYSGSDDGDGDDDDDDDSGVTHTGFCFWVSNSSATGNLSIYINSTYVGSLSVYFPSGTPNWGQTGTLVVSKGAGTYSISARDQDGNTWGPTNATLSATTPSILYEFR